MKNISIFLYKNLPDSKNGASNLVFSEFINYFKEIYSVVRVYIVNPRNHPKSALSIKKMDDGLLDKEILEINNFEDSTVPESDLAIFLDLKSALFARKIVSRNKIIWLGDLDFLTIWEHYKFSANLNILKSIDFPRVILKILLSVREYIISLREMDLIITSSANSEKYLKFIGFKSIFLPYPLRFKPQNHTLKEKSKVLGKKKIEFLFFGNHEGLGSKSTFKEFRDTVIPAMECVFGYNGFKLVVAGKINQKSVILKGLESKSSVIFSGYVDDIEELINTVDYCIFPVKTKVGNRSRIIHAISQGRIIITHLNATEGNPFLKNRENCLTYKRKVDLIETLKYLRDNPNGFDYIKVNAIKSFSNTYESRTAMTNIHKLLLEVEGQRVIEL